jgi:hypothetical protein
MLQELYRQCAVEKHAENLKAVQDQQKHAEDSQILQAAVDRIVVQHKAEVSSLRLENLRMKNSNERNVAALKEDINKLLQSRIPKEQFLQTETQCNQLREALEEARKQSMAATSALLLERRSRIEEMQRHDHNELRAKANIDEWKTRCREVSDNSCRVLFLFLMSCRSSIHR